MPEAGFEPADYNTKWQRLTIRPLPGWRYKGKFLLEKTIQFTNI